MYISVIIPTHNPGDYLWQCLDSFVHQTISPTYFEVIIILNGSKDPYYDEINKYILKHSEINFILIYTDKKGVSNARNIGIDRAKGEYISFVDDDDYVSTCYLEELLQNADVDTISLSNTLAFYVDKEWIPNQNITNDYCFSGKEISFYKARRFFNGPVYKLIHKNIIGNRRYDLTFKNGEDSLFMFLISDRFKKVVFTSPSAIYYRRLRPNSASQVKRHSISKIMNGVRLVFQYIKIYLKGFPHYNLYFLLTRIIGTLR